MDTVWLQRSDGDRPWGFRLSGGTDTHQPIIIHKVIPGSISSSQLSKGDVVLRIEDIPVSHLTLQEAHDIVKKCKKSIKLTLKRSGTPTIHNIPKIPPPVPQVINGVDSCSVMSDSDVMSSSVVSADSQDSIQSPSSHATVPYAHSCDSGFHPAFEHRTSSSVCMDSIFDVVPSSEPPPPPPAPPIPSVTHLQMKQKPKMHNRTTDIQEGARQQQYVPDVIETMMMKPGDKKPFSYAPGVLDLNEIKERKSTHLLPTKEIRESDVFRMVHGISPKMSRRQPDPQNYQQNLPSTPAHSVRNPDYEAEYPQYRNVSNPKKQSLSFKVLQWMTDTEETVPDDANPIPISVQDPRDRRILRRKESFNAEDDEMHFSGVSKSSNPIPSKSFNILRKMTSQDSDYYTPVQHPSMHSQDVYFDPNKVHTDNVVEVGNYDQTSIRYMGRNIPSRSFKMLQQMTGVMEDEPIEDSRSGFKNMKIDVQSNPCSFKARILLRPTSSNK